MADISKIIHPDYSRLVATWEKCRVVFAGGTVFLDTYLERFSEDELDTHFDRRKKLTPIAEHAKAAVCDVKNAIYQRMVDIVRNGGTESYQQSIKGENRGVDQHGSTMTSYIGTVVLPELLSIGKVGVLVDMPVLDRKITVAQAKQNRISPYLTMYTAEDIRSWSYNTNNDLSALLLRSYSYTLDPDYNLVTGTKTTYKYFVLNNLGVAYTEYEIVRNENSGKMEAREIAAMQLTIPVIPFVVFDLGTPLLEGVANHQIALLNMGSSDVDYAIKSNYPFYTEQVDQMSVMARMYASSNVENKKLDGTSELAQADLNKSLNSKKVRTGQTIGRAYMKGLERPGFIAPPADPLRVSMEKEQQLKEEIRQLINLSLANIKPLHASAESRAYDNRGLEAGLSYIGLELERCEREIAGLWATFESSSDIARITYPSNYSLRNDDERREAADKLLEIVPKIPSATFQKIAVKDAISLLTNAKVSAEELALMQGEVDNATIIVVDPEVLRQDHEAGLVSDKVASEARGYPSGDADQARKDKAERLALILRAQGATSSARGASDASPDPSLENEAEKTASQDPDLNGGKKRVRGEA